MKKIQGNPIIEEVDLDAPLKLYKVVNKKRTDRGWLLNKFDVWLTINEKSINTTTAYIKIIDKLIPKDKFEYPNITARNIHDFLNGRSGIYISATKTFLKFVFSEFGRRFSFIEFPKRSDTRDNNDVKTLSKKDIYKLIPSLPENHQLFTETLYICALRINEAYRIKVKDFKWSEWDNNIKKYGILVIPITKSGRKRKILINPYFMTKIYKFLINRDGKLILEKPLFVFKKYKKYFKQKMKLSEEMCSGEFLNLSEKGLYLYREENILHNFIKRKRNSFEKLFRKRSIKILGEPSHPHVLRASRLTHLLNSGMPLIQVRNFAGHKSIISTEFYLSSSLEDLRTTMEVSNL